VKIPKKIFFNQIPLKKLLLRISGEETPPPKKNVTTGAEIPCENAKYNLLKAGSESNRAPYSKKLLSQHPVRKSKWYEKKQLSRI
jgi:hypothetical protein